MCFGFGIVITYSKGKDQPGNVAKSCSWSALVSLSPIVPENLVSRDGFGSPVPRQPANLHTQAESGAYLRDSSRVPRRRPFIYLSRNTPSGQSRVYRVTQLRTDGVHCLESAITEPVNFNVVPNESCLGRIPWTNQILCTVITYMDKGIVSTIRVWTNGLPVSIGVLAQPLD